MTQLDSFQVGASTRVSVSIKVNDPIPIGGQIVMTFPYWNSAAPTSALLPLVANPSTVVCSSISVTQFLYNNHQVLSSALTCLFNSETNVLTIVNGFAAALAGGSTISFSIANLLNPLSFAPVTIYLYTAIADGIGIIDQGSATLTATAPAVIASSTALVTADVSTVQQYTNFNIQFYCPIPLNTGAQITINFPSQFNLDSQFTTVQGFGLFGSLRSLTFQVDDNQESVLLTNGIQAYKQAQIVGKLIFSLVANPDYVYASNSFSIYITDSSGFQIASVTTGITYTPASGVIQDVSASVGATIVSSSTSMTLTFMPEHSLSTQSGLSVTLPSQISSTCTGITYFGFSSSIACSSTTTNVFTFASPFATAEFEGNNTLSITFATVQLPQSAQIIGAFSILTYENIFVAGATPPSQKATVDSIISVASLFTVVPSYFLNQSLTVSTTQTYTSAIFTFSVIISVPVPIGGQIVVTLPSELTISTLTCIAITNLAPIGCSNNGQVVTLTGGFTSAKPKQTVLSFSIGGILTPPSTKTSDPIQMHTADSNGYLIDQATSLMTVTMLVGKAISAISASTNSFVVGASTQHTISFQTATPLVNGNYMYVTVPPEIAPPLQQNLYCAGSDSLNTYITCNVFGNTITIQLGAKTSPLAANSVLTIKFGTVVNPTSFKPSSPYQVKIEDVNGYSLCQTPTSNSAFLTMALPGTLVNATITPFDYQQEADTTITLTAVTVNPVPVGGYLQVGFNSIFFIVAVPVSCGSPLATNLTCNKYYDNNINVLNMFPQILYAGSQISITINNVLIDIKSKTISDSWTLTTFTSDNYEIDTIQNGLSLQFNCTFPCQSCPPTEPTTCLSCDSIQGDFILYNNLCLASCPGSLYYDPVNQTCNPCNSICLSCSANNPQLCTGCNPSSATNYLLDGTTCTDTCQFGYYASKSKAACLPCDSTCASCTTSSTNCLTCNQTLPQKYQYMNQCFSSCPSGYVADSTDNTCILCDPNCKTCLGSSTQCTTCTAPYILSLYDNTCVTTCPTGKTIYNSKTNVCQVCDPSCNTCNGTTTFCTSCAQNLALSELSGVCSSTCPGQNTQVSVNGVCTNCDDGCAQCVTLPSSCLACNIGKYLYDYQCVTTCPSGYGVDENNQCVIFGLRCPFGYKVNPLGNACLLMAQACNPGYQINLAKNGCIPVPTYYAPFPLCFCCLILSLMVIGSWFKFRLTLLATNIVAFMSVFETIGIYMLVISAYQLGLYSTFGLALVSLLFNYGCNLFFTLLYLKQISMDQAFKHWLLTYKITSNVLVVIGTLVNFKCYRLLYGRLFEKDHFNMAFEDKEAFFKPFTFVSIFSIITTMLPLLVGNIIGLVFIEYGYQAMMTCIELSIIELVILALMIYEKCTLKKTVLKQNTYYRADPKQMMGGKDDNVMSALDDSSSTFLTHKTRGETALTQGDELKQYYERRRHLESLITKMTKKNVGKKEETTLNEIKKMHEEQLLKLQQRNCNSYRDLKEVDEDFADQQAGDPCLQNFISTPNSPREKEMLRNPFFHGRMVEMKKAFGRDLEDNVYAESKPAHYFPLRDCKLISVKVQTSIIELLAIEDSGSYSRKKVASRLNRQKSDVEEYVEENVVPEYTQNLLDNVINTFQEETYKKQRRRLTKN